MKPKVLWITPKWPLPAEDGARRAITYLIQGLTNSGVSVHLRAIVPEGETPNLEEARVQLGVETAECISRPARSHFKNLISHPCQPITVAGFSTKKLAAEFSKILMSMPPAPNSVVVFDGLHAAGWLKHLPRSLRDQYHYVYRAHNIESSLWHQAARQEHSRLRSWLLSYQAHLVSKWEKDLCRRSILVAAVSAQDQDGLKARYGISQVVCTPIGMPIARTQNASIFPQKRSFLFLGRLDWQPNREGLQWLLDNVWGKVKKRAPDAELVVAGAGDRTWLEKYSTLNGVKILGRVDEVAPLYRDAAASLVPVFLGSGTRVKAIEASSYARPCISTALGVEGIGLDENSSFFRAESEEDWVNALGSFSVLEAEKRGRRAFELVSREFNPDTIAEKFWNSVCRANEP